MVARMSPPVLKLLLLLLRSQQVVIRFHLSGIHPKSYKNHPLQKKMLPLRIADATANAVFAAAAGGPTPSSRMQLAFKCAFLYSFSVDFGPYDKRRNYRLFL